MVVNSLRVKIRCPVCNAVTYKPSIETLLQEVENLWKPWQEWLSVEQRKHLQEMNRKERLEKILAEKGEITMFCPVCIFDLTLKLTAHKETTI